MSYFPCDIPYMSDEELRENGIKIHKDTETTDMANADDLISRQDAIDTVKRLLGDYEITRTVQTALRILPSAQQVISCDGCRFVGTYDTDFPCCCCIRREKDYYAKE